MNRQSGLAVIVLIALLCASCGRLPAETASPVATSENPFDANGSSNTVDIAGVIVKSEETVVPPAGADVQASEPSTPTTDTSSGDVNEAPSEQPPAAPITPQPVQKENPVVPDGGDTHTVLVGESLSTIAEKYSVSTQALKDFNGLDDADVIKEGQTLRIPNS